MGHWVSSLVGLGGCWDKDLGVGAARLLAGGGIPGLGSAWGGLSGLGALGPCAGVAQPAPDSGELGRGLWDGWAGPASRPKTGHPMEPGKPLQLG